MASGGGAEPRQGPDARPGRSAERGTAGGVNGGFWTSLIYLPQVPTRVGDMTRLCNTAKSAGCATQIVE
jgi:hypothetical protein